MTILEITLLILGAIIFIVSFFIPENKEEVKEMDKEFVQEQVAQALKEEMKNVHSRVEDTVEEVVNYSMERTERALERIANEKITAVSEYTETVLSDIHKSHEEVMFLYDMLNEKHANLKETASEVSKTVKEANEIVQEADQAKKEVSMVTQALDEALAAATEATVPESVVGEKTMAELQDFAPIDISGIEKLKQQAAKAEMSDTTDKKIENAKSEDTKSEDAKSENAKTVKAKPASSRRASSKGASHQKKRSTTAAKKQNSENISDMSMQFDVDQENKGNSNERILELYKKGKSNVAIAKELGLGVGEVKLVIDLFKGI